MMTRQILRTTLALGVAVTALSTAAWATNSSCSLKKFQIRYYASDVDTYHNKKVDAYCREDEKPISCEAEVFTSHDYDNDENKYLVALNEVFEFKNTDHASSYYNRQGCRARANTIFANYDGYPQRLKKELVEESSGLQGRMLTEERSFYWGLKVYATCVPKDCVDKHAGDGEYEYYDHESSTPEEPVVLPVE